MTGSGWLRSAPYLAAVLGGALALAPTLLTPSLATLCLAGEAAVRPGEVWAAWSFAPEILAPLLGFVAAYEIGRRKPGAAVSTREAAATALGVLLLVLALVSPLCRLAATLAWAHMVQHLILVALAPACLVLGGAHRVLQAALHRSWPGGRARQAIGPPRRILLPALVYGAAIWTWHVPELYQASLRNSTMHLALIGSLLLISAWFWRAVLEAPRHALGAAALLLLATMIHTAVLGAALTLSPRPWYPLLSPGALAWGLRPLEDQQLAGLIMWVPMGAIYIGAALLVLARGLTSTNASPERGDLLAPSPARRTSLTLPA